MTKNWHTVKNVLFMDFCSYLFWANDNMYEFLLLFVLLNFCFFSLVPCDLSIWCKTTVLTVSDKFSKAPYASNVIRIMFFLNLTFGTIQFFSVAFFFSVMHNAYNCLLFFFIMFDILNGNRILHFIVIIKCKNISYLSRIETIASTNRWVYGTVFAVNV